MCQFNLILVQNAANKEILKRNEYNYWGSKLQNYSPYAKGHCNCNSFVGSMSEYNGNSYLEMIEASNKSEIRKLLQIKEFMNKPNYTELIENYIKTRDSLSNNIEKLFDPISNYEIEQLDLLEKKYKGNELQRHTKILYKELDNKMKKIENSSEYKSAQAKLDAFISQNELMEESTLYYLTQEAKDADCEYLLDDQNILQNELIEISADSIEYVSLPDEESLVIDDLIKKLENQYTNDYNTFLEYTQLFEKLLENEEYILFCCIWDEPGKTSITKEVNINDIAIEDLANLKFNEMLKIYK